MPKRQNLKELEKSEEMSDKKSKKIRPEGAEDNSEKVPETISPFPTIEEFGGELQNSRSKLNFFLFQIKPNNCK